MDQRGTLFRSLMSALGALVLFLSLSFAGSYWFYQGEWQAATRRYDADVATHLVTLTDEVDYALHIADTLAIMLESGAAQGANAADFAEDLLYHKATFISLAWAPHPLKEGPSFTFVRGLDTIDRYSTLSIPEHPVLLDLTQEVLRTGRPSASPFLSVEGSPHQYIVYAHPLKTAVGTGVVYSFMPFAELLAQGELMSPVQGITASSEPHSSLFTRAHEFRVWQRSWTLYLSPTEDYIWFPHGQRSPLVLAFSITLALLLSFYIGTMYRRRQILSDYCDQLQQRQVELEELRDRADAANRAKSLFLANMSHELRTPLNGVLGAAELLKGYLLPKKASYSVDIIESSGRSLLALINDVLDLSKIEAEQMELESIPFDLYALLEDILLALEATAQRKSLTTGVLYDPAVPRRIVGCPSSMRKIIGNLVGNALKFTKTGHVLVNVSKRGDTLVLRVTDTGIGIPADKLDHVFQKFSQADDSTTRFYGGTGLGLALCRELSGLLGGSISVKSEVGNGSQFELNLPLHSSTQNVLPYQDSRTLLVEQDSLERDLLENQLVHLGFKVDVTSAVGNRNLDDYQLVVGHKVDPSIPSLAITSATEMGDDEIPLVIRSKRLRMRIDSLFGYEQQSVEPESARFEASILLVEDNPINQDVAKMLLERLGCRVEIASDGVEGVTRATAGSHDLVLMDWQMPRLTGLEATRQLRQQGYTTPIIALTANAFTSDQEACLAAGMDGFMTKPLQTEILVDTLKTYLGGFQVADHGHSCLKEELGEDYAEFAQKYVRISQDLIANIAAALDKQDSDAIAMAAHSLRSCSLDFQADLVAQCAEELELQARGLAEGESEESYQNLLRQHATFVDGL